MSVLFKTKCMKFPLVTLFDFDKRSSTINRITAAKRLFIPLNAFVNSYNILCNVLRATTCWGCGKRGGILLTHTTKGKSYLTFIDNRIGKLEIIKLTQWFPVSGRLIDLVIPFATFSRIVCIYE